MKRLLLIISILALVLLPMGCNPEDIIKSTIEEALAGLRADYTIQVGGTEGLNFSADYVVVNAQYDPDTYVVFTAVSYNVTGNVSAQYTATNATSVGGMFQKKSGGSEILTVRILKGGVEVDSATTTDPYGAVFVISTRVE